MNSDVLLMFYGGGIISSVSMLLTPSSISINGLNPIICLLRIITVLF